MFITYMRFFNLSIERGAGKTVFILSSLQKGWRLFSTEHVEERRPRVIQKDVDDRNPLLEKLLGIMVEVAVDDDELRFAERIE